MKTEYLLDACAMLALINEEDGADIVGNLVSEAANKGISLFMSFAQLIEVYYDRIYVQGIDFADDFLEEMYNSNITIIHEIPRNIVREAGRFKTTYSMSFADSIACATAYCLQMTFVTSDHHELEKVDESENIAFLWLPEHPKK